MNKENSFIYRLISRVFFEDHPVEYSKKPISFCDRQPHPPVQDFDMCPYCAMSLDKK